MPASLAHRARVLRHQFKYLCTKMKAQIEDLPEDERRDLGRSASRLLASRSVNAADFLRLCARLGIDPRTGEARDAIAAPQEVALFQISTGCRIYRKLHGITFRQAATETGVSAATILRLEQNLPVSAFSVLAVCDFIGVHPFHYMQNEKRRAA